AVDQHHRLLYRREAIEQRAERGRVAPVQRGVTPGFRRQDLATRISGNVEGVDAVHRQAVRDGVAGRSLARAAFVTGEYDHLRHVNPGPRARGASGPPGP